MSSSPTRRTKGGRDYCRYSSVGREERDERRAQLDAAAALADAAAAVGADVEGCRAEAEARLDQLAGHWHLELAKSAAARNEVTAWELEERVATTTPRRAAAARKLAILIWECAEDQDSRDLDAWTRAAEAAETAPALDPAAGDLARRAVEARHNARWARRGRRLGR